MKDAKQHRVLNLGAGIQSTTLYLMAVAGEISFDCAVFADTKEEPASVYRHLDWLDSLNGPPIHRVSNGSLGENLIRGINSTSHRFVSIPAYIHSGRAGERGGITRRQCTSEYKIRPIEQWIRRSLLGLRPRQRVPNGVSVTQIYGISMDEARRAMRIRERMKATPWLKPEFPLLERLMTRADCVAWLRKFGVPHEVPRSACVFCPYRSDAEWLRLRNEDPEGWRRALEIDEALRKNGTACNRGLRGKLFLHRSCRPLAEVELREGDERWRQLSISFALECAGMCGI